MLIPHDVRGRKHILLVKQHSSAFTLPVHSDPPRIFTVAVRGVARHAATLRPENGCFLPYSKMLMNRDRVRD
jgi:hypothetical protein